MNDSENQSTEQREAMRTTVVLSKTDAELDAHVSSEDLRTWKLGQAIRESATAVCPKPDDGLRTTVLAQLDGDTKAVHVKSPRRVWAYWIGGVLATSASLLMAISYFGTPLPLRFSQRSGPRFEEHGVRLGGGVPADIDFRLKNPRTNSAFFDTSNQEASSKSVATEIPGDTQKQESLYAIQVPNPEAHAELHNAKQSYDKYDKFYKAPFYPYQPPKAQVPGGWRYRSMAEKQSGAWATKVNRQWLDSFPAPGLPGTDTGAGERYARYAESSFIEPRGNAALSTFSIDVDTASYSNTRRFLRQKQLPPPDAVRVEEFLNYFQYDYPEPDGDHPFSVKMELAGCPWNDQNKLLRIGLKGKTIERDKRPPSNIVFLLDVSGSMRSADKLPLMQRGLKMMVKQLREDDFVSIVTYAGNAGVALNPTCGDDQDQISDVIDSLQSGGSTNGSAGIDRAYELAAQNFVKGGTNRVILATDGDLNVGITDDADLAKLIKAKAGEGVFLTVLGFGTGNLQDGKMEKLADNGNGVYAYIDSAREAHKTLVQQISGSLVTIAKDVKLQLEFNPKLVKSYRLIGYDNRILAAKDFEDDTKDAGEIGAGHTVTAFYEVVPTTAAVSEQPAGEPIKLKYQQATSTEKATTLIKLTDAAQQDELLTMQLRYKQPDGQISRLLKITCKDAVVDFKEASTDFRFASSVAAFGMLLRQSKFAGSADLAMCEEIASDALGDDSRGIRSEFVDLVRIASELFKNR